MHNLREILFTSFMLLISTSGIQAQYRWHVIHPNQIDTFYYGFNSVSCSGENCSAVGEVYGYEPGKSETPDSDFIIHSTDGGQSWISVDSIPQRYFSPYGNYTFYFGSIQQIDTLNAIAVDQLVGGIIWTSDNWQTFQMDTTNCIFFQAFGKDTIAAGGYYNADFSNAAEGMVNQGFGFYYSTLDSGKNWNQEIIRSSTTYRSYGNGMFRVFATPDTIFTTHDGWKTSDTSLITVNDSIENFLLTPELLSFGGNDSLALFSLRFDSSKTHYSLSIALSTDLGQSWRYPLLDTVQLNPEVISSQSNNTIVIAGDDSSGHIVISTDHGVTWNVYSVPLDNGMRYHSIISVTVTSSGHVLACIEPDSTFGGSDVLAYLEPVSSGVTQSVSPKPFSLFPNPATNLITLPFDDPTVEIFDPLGRKYAVPISGTSLDISALPSGIYYLYDGVTSGAKFVKE